MKLLKKYIPILEWLPKYKQSNLKGDLIAGITVGVMLIPQGMAYSMLAGLPPIYGLYASIIPLLAYAIFGTSRQLAVGPVAMISLLIATGIGAIAGNDLVEFIRLAFVLSLMVGVFLLVMGMLRMGFLVNFLSHPVIAGFTSAAALIIGFSQLKYLLGFPIPKTHFIHETLIYAIENFDQVNYLTLLIGSIAIILMLIIKKVKPSIPGPLVAVFLGILLVWGMDLPKLGVGIVGEVPQGLPVFSVPVFSWSDIQSLLPIALTIALVGFMESIAVAKSIQSKHKDYQIDPNQEFIGLGMANVLGAFFQAFPTTGGFSRTAVNDQSGAKTNLAAVISAALIALTLLFLTPLFYFLPNAILAAVIMVAVIGLVDIKEAKHLWKIDRADFWMMAATFLATLILGIEGGILTGVVLSLLLIIYRTSQPHIAELAKVPGKNTYRNVERFTNLEKRADILIIRFDARLYFANVNAFMEFLENKISAQASDLKTIILDAESMNNMDSSGVLMLEQVIENLEKQNLNFCITGLKGPLRDVFHKSNLIEKVGKENLFLSIQDAVDRIDNLEKNRNLEHYILQSNIETT